MADVEAQLAAAIAESVRRVVDPAFAGDVPVERSNRPELGDYASPVAFQLARGAGRPPMAIAEAIAGDLAVREPGLVGDCTASAPAFVNVRLSNAFLEALVGAAHRVQGAIADLPAATAGKVVIEHTNINPNKAAHVGHFRNACLGDTIARLLAKRGHAVEVQNYIDDTGVQVADVVAGLRFMPMPEQSDLAFDRYCSDVYVEVQRRYAADPALLAHRRTVQAAVEEGTGELAAFAHEVASRIARCNLATMARAGIGYDLLTWESDILRLGFWNRAFERLREAGAVRLEVAGPNAGCWVVPFGLGTVDTEGGTVTEDKVLVTSAETVTYTAKDIAYQLWKFGVLGQDFYYRLWDPPVQHDGRPLWTTLSDPEAADPGAPAFAGGERVINVIDDRQSYPQQVVAECLRRLGYDGAADASQHLAYAVVTLSAAAARELGVDVAEGQTSVAMSGRGGIQVYADDLLDRLVLRLVERMRDPDAALAVAVGAARYYMLKFGNTQPITFDFDEALRTTGETGVYLQYAHVRACGILRRMAAEGLDAAPAPPPDDLPRPDRDLVLSLATYPRVLAAAAAELSAQTVAKYAFELATAFSTFYDNTTPILKEPDPALRAWRSGLVTAARLVLADALGVLGIPALERI